MSRDKTVVLSGGLGNQLFQFCFAHLLAAQNSGKVTIYAPKSKNGARDFILHSLTLRCSHIAGIRLKRSWCIDISFRFRDFVRNRFGDCSDTILERFFYREKNTYSYVDGLLSQKYYSGYFQNWQFVFEGLEFFNSELSETVSQQSLPHSQQLGSELYGVVHFRRGDLLDYYQSMGVLEDDYFLDAVNLAFIELQKKVKVIVLTDDKELGAKSFAGVADEVYGPDEIDEWQGLKIMSGASFVVTSNSTYSWWGGLLASKNGGAVYIPTPWFLNWTPDPGSAFEYPSFRNVPSKFKIER